MGTKLEIIQVLRGIAALLVVLLHFRSVLADAWPWTEQAFSHGSIGVDIFFVISGFVIYTSTERSRDLTSGSFLVRRFFRVVVPAWAAIFLLVCLKRPYLYSLLLSVLFIPLENGHPPGYGYNVLIVVWTLTYELVFYAIFSLTLCSTLTRRYRGTIATVLLVGLVVAVQAKSGTYTLNADAVGVLPSGNHFPMQIISLLGNPLLLMFPIGIGLAWSYHAGWIHSLRNGRYVLLAAALLAAATDIKLQYHDGNGLTNSGVLASLIVICALLVQSLIDTSAVSRDRKWLVLVGFVGELSFSLYLMHPLIKMTFTSLLTESAKSSPLKSMSVFLLMLGCTVAVSFFFYKVVEMPAQRCGKSLSFTPRISSVTQERYGR